MGNIFIICSCTLFFFYVGVLHAQYDLSLHTSENRIVIDGQLENIWYSADSIDQFTQLEPNRGETSSRRTVVRTVLVANDLFLSFVCYTNKSDVIASRIQRRDKLDESDDIVAILLDTYHDKRTALLFLVNAIGTLTDSKVSDDGKSVDFNWDTEWEAKSTIFEEGWQTEIRIPLRSIQYAPNASMWGINFGRVIRSNQETVWWSPVTENFRVSQCGNLLGITREAAVKNKLNIFPYGTLRYENSDITQVYNKWKTDAGLDLQFQPSSNFVANISLNPDFATVEGDREQINLTPWELRFPEKRLFFQDGNELFGTRINTFYSRRIGDMKYGGKFIGKTGKYQFNALFAKTEENQFTDESKAWFNAFRIKRDIFNSSTLGITYADKISDTSSFRSLSMDYVLNLGKTWKFTGQFVTSAPGDWQSHSAWYMRFARENNQYHYHVRYSNFGRNFRDNVNQTGFIRDDDRHELDSDISYRFWFKQGIKYLFLSGKNNIFWSLDGILRSWYVTYSTRAYFTNRISLDFFYNNEYKLLDQKYYNYFYGTVVGYNTDEASFVNMSYRFGRNFLRNFRLFEAATRVQLFKKLSINYQLNYIHYSPDPGENSTTINIIGLDYFFNKDLWLRIFAQNNTNSDKIYLYGLFGWRFRPPFGAAYLIYNSDSFNQVASAEQIDTRILFIKLTYPLSLL